MKPRPPSLWRLPFDVARGLALDREARRKSMTALILAAAAMVFLGGTILDRWLQARPWLFVFYWLACGWVTLAAVLVALYDVIALRRTARDARRRLAREVLAETDPDHGAGRPPVNPSRT